MSEAEQLEIVIRNLETRLDIARKNLDKLNVGPMTSPEKELLTPEVVDGWKRVATAQLENYRERIVIPTTLLLAMINKIQANEAKNEHG
jgi:hypothetical protein